MPKQNKIRDPRQNVNLQNNAPQKSVVRIEGINSQESSINYLENDIIPEIMTPRVFITEGSMPLFIGADKSISIESQTIPVLNETRTKIFSQLNSLRTEADNSFVSKSKSLASASFEEKTFPEVIPNSSTRYAINEQIELIHPLNYTSKPTPMKFNSFKNDNFVNKCKIKSDSAIELENTIGLINCPSNDIKFFLNQPLQVQSSLQINPQSLNSSFICEESVKDSKVSFKNTKKTIKRRVQNYVHISDVRAPQRAIAVLPTALQIRGKDTIFPRRTLPARIRFGPVEGTHNVVTSAQADELKTVQDAPVFLLRKDNAIVHIDVSDKDKCNWMGLLPLGGEANVWLYQEEDQLFAITTEPINARRPLKLGYSKKYAEEYKLPTGVPTLDLETVLSSNPKQWWCNECNRALPTASLLQRHSDVYHKDDIISTSRGYRCHQCRRMYSRLFTLRRHISKHCTRKTVKLAEATEPNPPPVLNSTLNIEENRIPSDESFQNFTNGLDFSTCLFDTDDRISNIDISGNSRADADFNPYDITFRDDTCTINDLSFSKLTSEANKTSHNEVKKESTPDSCTYCSKIVIKGNRRKHLRECPTRKLECACGKNFKNRDKLSQHFLKEHSAENASEMGNKSPDKNKYTCEQCNSKRFKRRGMLVNHLWRAHKIVSTTKVERPVRHYPCVACSKIYRSAAKRDRHIVVHHPGAEKLATQSIAGGVRSCEPAACVQCPRQYATRAKLLQHVRMHHANTQRLSGKDNFSTDNY